MLANSIGRIMRKDRDIPITPETQERLFEVRAALLGLHKAILDVERADYERQHGRVDPHRLLHLLTSDSAFGWFRPLSEMIVQFDLLLESDDVVTERQVSELFRDARSLLQPAAEGEEFAVRYRAIFQAHPDIILSHAALVNLLGGPSKK